MVVQGYVYVGFVVGQVFKLYVVGVVYGGVGEVVLVDVFVGFVVDDFGFLFYVGVQWCFGDLVVVFVVEDCYVFEVVYDLGQVFQFVLVVVYLLCGVVDYN